ncbi:MAG TPA: hypothetical protein VMW91_12070 [Desulfosporosinus sp.]|nr:hypothetical protein [Desulfosporosinus sp.]
MKNKLCVSTVVSADDFQWFIPLFVTSARLAYSQLRVCIFVKGCLSDKVSTFLQFNPFVYCNQWPNIPNKKSTHNSLRHLVDPKYYHDCDYIYPTDVDFIILPHKISHVDYYAGVMKDTGLSYAAARGPIRGFARQKGILKWDGPHTRVAAGCSMYKYPDFYNKTKRAREYYLKCFEKDCVDKFDKHLGLKVGSYREFDEVMLYRMMRMSGLKTPSWKNCFPNQKKMNPRYRDIHLGDFKFPKRYGNMGKMKRILTDENVKRFIELEKNEQWMAAVELVRENCDSVYGLIKKLRSHIEKRVA